MTKVVDQIITDNGAHFRAAWDDAWEEVFVAINEDGLDEMTPGEGGYYIDEESAREMSDWFKQMADKLATGEYALAPEGVFGEGRSEHESAFLKLANDSFRTDRVLVYVGHAYGAANAQAVSAPTLREWAERFVKAADYLDKKAA